MNFQQGQYMICVQLGDVLQVLKPNQSINLQRTEIEPSPENEPISEKLRLNWNMSYNFCTE